jgi:hypothetical protein
MRLSAAHCLEQQAAQLAIAAECALESRRAIALKAAAAWGVEAAAADKRESGQLAPHDLLDAEITREFALEDENGVLIDPEPGE